MDISKEQPLVTVYMPTHNRVELLQRAVESVLNQDYKNIELIVVDDKSTDSTPEYLAELVKKDSRVRFFRNEVNSGACVSRNKAIFAAKGEFVTGLDDDDYFMPERISEFVNAWRNKREDSIFLYSNYLIKSSKGVKKTYKKPKYCNAKSIILANWVGNQIFIKKETLIDIDGFDPDFPMWQDFECWYRILSYFKACSENVPFYSYIVDMSHPHERITNNKESKVLEAFYVFSRKHYLSSNDKEMLSFHLVNYNIYKVSFYSAMKKSFALPKYYNIRNSIILFLLPYIKFFI